MQQKNYKHFTRLHRPTPIYIIKYCSLIVMLQSVLTFNFTCTLKWRPTTEFTILLLQIVIVIVINTT